MIPEAPQPIAGDPPLPQDLGACHAMIRQLLDTQRKDSRRIERLEHQLEQLLRRLYGRSSERLDPNQMVLFEDLLKRLQQEAAAAPPPETPTAPPAPSASKGHGRRRIPADLPRRRVVHDLPEEEKPCPCCGKRRELIGEETSEQLDYAPAQLSVIEHVRLKYACRACEQAAAEGGPQIATAEKPLAPIEKGLAAPGLLAYVIVSKYSDHLPLYRLERILKRHQIAIARSTLCDWMRDSAAALKPLYDLMVREGLASKVLHTDDTPVDVLDRHLPETRVGRFWVYVGDPDHPYDIKSPMGQAIAYVLNQWDALAVYVTDGDLDIDNNTAENALRRIAIGRKNWLFAGSDNGGHTAAVLFSLIATCQRHDVEPFAYLRDVLTRIAAHPMHRLADLLPDQWKQGRSPAIPDSPTAAATPATSQGPAPPA